MVDAKRCTKCGLEKTLDEFHRSAKGKHQRLPRCKICVNTANSSWAKANRSKVTASGKAWRTANPGRATAISRAWQLRHPEQSKQIRWKGQYGIDFPTLWDAQGGKCASCSKPMRREGKEVDSVCVDHDRSCCPGKKSCGKCVRGLIHRNCNLVLGYAKDDIEVLRKAIEYLERWRGRESTDVTPFGR